MIIARGSFKEGKDQVSKINKGNVCTRKKRKKKTENEVDGGK